MAGNEKTKRAEIFLKVLDCINRDAYDDFEKYLIFGGSLDDLLWDAEHPRHGEESHPLREVRELGDALGEVVADMHDRRGRTVAERRTSLDPPFEEKRAIKGLDRLEQLNRELANELERLTEKPYVRPATPAQRDAEWDLLDRKYAKEVLGKLSKIVRRVSALETLDIQGIPNERTRRYFEEAHRCYIYGFPVACAVLCRAIIESSLQEAIDLRQSLQNPKTVLPGDLDAHAGKLELLIARAKQLGLLSDDGRDCADDVRNAGNWAVHPHSFEKFNQHYGTEGVAQVVANTRKVLQELYGQVETR